MNEGDSVWFLPMSENDAKLPNFLQLGGFAILNAALWWLFCKKCCEKFHGNTVTSYEMIQKPFGMM